MTGWVAATGVAMLIGAAATPGTYGNALTAGQDFEAFEWVTPGLEQSLRVLRTSGSQIGVAIRDVTQDDLKGKTGAAGVSIESVETDGPAAKAGFKEGDVVVEFDGERIRSSRQFTRLVQETVPGRSVPAVVLRDGQRVTLTVEPRESGPFRVGSLKSPQVVVPRSGDLDVFPKIAGMLGTARLGVSITELSPQLADYFGVKDGVLVTSVSDNSVANKIGVRAGDVITAVDGGTVSTGADLRRRMQRLEGGDEFTLGIVRDKKAQSLKGKLELSPASRTTTRTIL